jgi:hypothetical protein
LYRGIDDFRKGYQPRTIIVKDKKDYVVADSHSIMARWRNYFSQLLNVHGVKYLGITLTNQNSIQAEIKSRLKLGNACYYLVQNILSFRLLSKNLKIKIDRTIILPFVLYGCEAWSLTLREERRLKVFENRVIHHC